jgi:hypothetical protein
MQVSIGDPTGDDPDDWTVSSVVVVYCVLLFLSLGHDRSY